MLHMNCQNKTKHKGVQTNFKRTKFLKMNKSRTFYILN